MKRYLNVMRIDGSPTQAYHREHYGADYDYYNFAPLFDQEIKKWNPDISFEKCRCPHREFAAGSSADFGEGRNWGTDHAIRGRSQAD